MHGWVISTNRHRNSFFIMVLCKYHLNAQPLLESFNSKAPKYCFVGWKWVGGGAGMWVVVSKSSFTPAKF